MCKMFSNFLSDLLRVERDFQNFNIVWCGVVCLFRFNNKRVKEKFQGNFT